MSAHRPHPISSANMEFLARLFEWAGRHPRLATALALALPVLVAYAPVLMGLRTFPQGDFTDHFLPFSIFHADALRAGRLPLWNPHTYAGHPFLADTQAAVFYPVSTLLLLLTLAWKEPAARLYLLEVDAVLHTLLAAWFTFVLLRELGVRRWAGVLGGLSFALSGYLLSYPPLQLAILRSTVWLPLLLALMLRSARSRGPSWSGVWAGIIMALAFLGGHPQTAMQIVYSALAWWLLLIALRWRDAGVRAALAATLWTGLLPAAVALAVSLPQLLPSLEFVGLSVRARIGFDAVAGGFPLRDLGQAIVPGIFTHFSPVYFAATALLLALLAVGMAVARRAAGRPSRAFTLFFALMALTATGLSLGENGPFYRLAWRYLPGWDLFRGQERAAFLVTLALSVLTGLGGEAVSGAGLRDRRRVALAGAAALIAAIYAAGLFWQLPDQTVLSDSQYIALAGSTILATSAAAIALWLPGWSRERSALLAVLALLPLTLTAGRNFEAVSLRDRVALAPEVVALEAAAAESRGEDGLPGRVYNEFRTWEDYSMRTGIEDLWGSSPLRLARYAAFAEEFPLDRWWTLTGVEHVLTWREELFVPSAILASFPQSDDTTWLHRLTEPAPRAWFAEAVRIADDTSALALLADHDFDLRSTLLLPPESGAVEASLPGAPGSVTIEAVTPERLRVRVEGGVESLLYIGTPWMPGWHVEQAPVAGAPILGMAPFSVQRAHLAFMAIPLPVGSHDFDLVYEPATLKLALRVSGSTVALLAVLALATRFRRRIP